MRRTDTNTFKCTRDGSEVGEGVGAGEREEVAGEREEIGEGAEAGEKVIKRRSGIRSRGRDRRRSRIRSRSRNRRRIRITWLKCIHCTPR